MKHILLILLLAGGASAQTAVPVAQLAGGSVVGVLLADGAGKLVVAKLAGSVVVDWQTTPPTVSVVVPAAAETRLTLGSAGWTAPGASCSHITRNGLRMLPGLDYSITAAGGVVTVAFVAAQQAQASDVIAADCAPNPDASTKR